MNWRYTLASFSVGSKRFVTKYVTLHWCTFHHVYVKRITKTHQNKPNLFYFQHVSALRQNSWTKITEHTQKVLNYTHKNSSFPSLCGATAKNGPRTPRIFEVSKSHTIRHTHTRARACGRTLFFNEWWARRKDHYLRNIKHAQETNIYAISEFRTRNSSNGTAADLRLRSHNY